MFLRALGIRSTYGVSVNDSEGRTVHKVETHFKDLFAPNLTTNPCHPLCTELCYPITQMEVQDAALKIKNNCACSPDLVPKELLKYACAHNETTQWIAHLLNGAVEGKLHLNNIGTGVHTSPEERQAMRTSVQPETSGVIEWHLDTNVALFPPEIQSLCALLHPC